MRNRGDRIICPASAATAADERLVVNIPNPAMHSRFSAQNSRRPHPISWHAERGFKFIHVEFGFVRACVVAHKFSSGVENFKCDRSAGGLRQVIINDRAIRRILCLPEFPEATAYPCSCRGEFDRQFPA